MQTDGVQVEGAELGAVERRRDEAHLPGPTQEGGADGGAVEDHEVLDSEVAQRRTQAETGRPGADDDDVE